MTTSEDRLSAASPGARSATASAVTANATTTDPGVATVSASVPAPASGAPASASPSTRRPAPKELGLLACTALVVGNMIGSGVFLLPGPLARYGGLALVAWGFTSAGALLLALVFARFSTMYPDTGGPYAYVQRVFGDRIGFFTGWGYWIAVWVGIAAIAIAAVSYLAYFVEPLAHHRFAGALIAVALSWAATLANVRGVGAAGVVSIVLTALKLIPLVGIAVVGLFFLDRGSVPEFNPSGGSPLAGVTGAATLTLWAFIGMESATVPADSVRDPRRTIPRATVLGVALAASVYILATFVVMTLVPAAELADSPAPFAAAARVVVGDAGGWIVAAGGLIACLGAMVGWVMMQGQIPLAAARDGLFPRPFARLDAGGTPAFGLIASNVLVTVLILTTAGGGPGDQFERIILIATSISLVPYGLTAIALLRLLRTDRAAFDASALVRYG
ncbi:amino acid permease [Embleya sp. NPDC020630]|uniref:amino acid permease n=1 Tax=Embleya sp. NPDC020630 TaxID=3363979 RepID=UPI0037976CCF